MSCYASQTYNSVKVRWGESRQWIWNTHTTHARRKKRKPTDGWNERSSWECHCMALTRRAWTVNVHTVQWTKIHHYFAFCQLNISCSTDYFCGCWVLFSFSTFSYAPAEIITFRCGIFPFLSRCGRVLCNHSKKGAEFGYWLSTLCLWRFTSGTLVNPTVQRHAQ